MPSELLKGFSDSEADRIEAHINDLIPHLTPGKFVVVGGLAVRYHVENAGISFPQRPFNDVDLVAEDFSVVYPNIVNEFLTYHVHREGNTFYFAFVDPNTRIKVDIFDSTYPVKDKTKVKIGINTIDLISAENQLITLIPTILLASDKLKRDPKLVEEMNLLASISDMQKAQRLWEEMGEKGSVEMGIKRVNEFRLQNPQFFKEKPYHKQGPYKCLDCIEAADFPIVPMEKVYKVLGYVE